MNLSAVLRPFLGPPDPRSAGQIAADLDDEFAFHIAHIEREILESEPALPPAEASRRARERFGDWGSIKKRCGRIAMEERIMLQWINTALMAVVVVAVVGVSAQVALTQRHNTLALQDITMQIASMRVDAGASDVAAGATDAMRSKVLPLRFASADGVREALSTWFGPSADDPAMRSVKIVVDPRTNSLIIVAQPGQWEEIVEAVKDLDLDAAGAKDEASD